MSYATINGIQINFELHGDSGEPLVLVHGYTGDLTDWRRQLPEFAPTNRVLIMDHRGHGQSGGASDRASYNILEMADDVEALVEHVGFDRYHLLGHSMGGTIVQEIALRHPGRLMSLTLEDTAFKFSMRENEIATKFIAYRNQIAEEQGMAGILAMPKLTEPPMHMPKERSAETDIRLSKMSVDAYIGAWEGLEAWEGTEHRAQDIGVPTMVLYGELDAPLIVGASKFLAKTIPGAVLEKVPEAAHSPQYERPQIFNPALRRHLDRNASVGAAK